ncbi:MAG TPA: hypothetical protein PLN27_17765 [Acidobacteriota bacterium]|nr:hypothetical protein [Acidobacteriota bacterium]
MRVETRLILLGCVGLLAAAAAGQGTPAPPAGAGSAADVEFMRRVAEFRPFLEDSPDVQADPKTIGKFFTPDIYRKLRGNPFFGYRHDEGYTPPAGKTIRLRVVRTLPALKHYEAALRYALVAGAVDAGLQPGGRSDLETGVCLLGVDRTSRPGQAGVLLEAYMLNVRTNKARYLRYAFGRPELDETLLLAAAFLMRLTQQHERSAPWKP